MPRPLQLHIYPTDESDNINNTSVVESLLDSECAGRKSSLRKERGDLIDSIASD
jgi:hypothetical protein